MKCSCNDRHSFASANRTQRGDQDGASDSGGSGIEKILVTIGCIFGGLAVLAAGLIWGEALLRECLPHLTLLKELIHF